MPSSRASPAAGPSRSLTAMARLKATIGGRRPRQQLVVELHDLVPVGVGGVRGVGVHGGDRGLDLEGPGEVAAEARPDDRVPFADLAGVPAGAVLIGEADERPVGGGAGRPPCVGQQHQRQEAVRLGLVGHELDQQPAEPDGLVAQLATDEGVTGGGGVALVEDEVDHGEHRPQPGRQLGVGRHPVGDVVGADLLLGPHQPLRHRRLRHEEGPGDLGGLQAGDQPQGQRHLGGGGQGGMTAGEDEAEAVVVHRRPVLRVARLGVDQHLGPALALVAGRLPPHPVESPVAGRGDDPGGRVRGQAARRPALERDGEGLLDRFLGDVDVAEVADQGGHRSARLGTEDPLDLCIDAGADRSAHGPVRPRARPGRDGPPRRPGTPGWPRRPRRGRRRGRVR